MNMFAIFKNEWKTGIKNLLIWSLSVGAMGLICILLYKSMEDSMADMADSNGSAKTSSSFSTQVSL